VQIGPDNRSPGMSNPRVRMVLKRFHFKHEASSPVGAKILPKLLISAIPVQREPQTETLKPETSPDLILIDDDPMTHRVWKIEARSQGLHLLARLREGEVEWDSIPKKTPVYVDYRLGNGVSGLEVAKQLHRKGFKQVFLCTGEPARKFSGTSFLKGVVGKGFPRNCWANRPESRVE